MNNTNTEYIPFYVKYKQLLIPVVFVFLTFFTIFRVIIPQLESIGNKNAIISEKSREVDMLNNSMAVITSTNEQTLTSDLETATKALPTSKNVALIFEALTSAAETAGVDLSEFNLKVGGVYGRAEKLSTDVKGTPQINVITRISNTQASNIAQFASEVQKRLPLAEVKTVDANGTVATVEINFYYKPLDLTKISTQDNVPPISASDQKLLNDINDEQ